LSDLLHIRERGIPLTKEMRKYGNPEGFQNWKAIIDITPFNFAEKTIFQILKRPI